MQKPIGLTIHDLSEREILILNSEVDKRRKSVTAIWLLWFFLGVWGGHRFFLGKVGTGFAMLFTLGGFGVWWIIDAFRLSGMIKENGTSAQDEVLLEIAAMRKKPSVGVPQPA